MSSHHIANNNETIGVVLSFPIIVVVVVAVVVFVIINTNVVILMLYSQPRRLWTRHVRRTH